MPHHHGRSGRSMGIAQGSKKSTSTGSGNGNTRTHHSSNVTYTPTPVSSGAAKRQKAKVKASILKKGAEDLTNYKVKQVTGLVNPILKGIANTATGVKVRQWSFEKNRDFFRKKVLTSKNVGNFENTLDSYKAYMKGRQEGTLDAYGRTISKSGNGDTRPVVEKNVGGQTILAAAPTEAEVSQSDAANAAETKLTKRRVKARGRKMNIYAQSKDKLTLGKKTLLGVV